MEKPNLVYIENISKGDLDFEKNLIDILKSEFFLDQKSYFDNLNLRNFNATAESVHKIRHKISILGMEKGHKLASKYEKNLLRSNPQEENEFEAILNVISDFLKTL